MTVSRLDKLSMSSVAALLNLIEHTQTTGGDLVDALSIVPHTTTDRASHDYEGAALLIDLLPLSADPIDFPLFLRELITVVLLDEKPSWLSIVHMGRDAVRNVLSANQEDVFIHSGLFDAIPSEDVVAWWDRLALPLWTTPNGAFLELGRAAERRSFLRELERLKIEGCGLSPRWVSLDDNSVGYDIASWTKTGDTWSPLLIEVKSTTGRNPEFYLSRNEFRAAASARSEFLIHVWAAGELHVYHRDQVLTWAPADGEHSRWEKALFEIKPES